MYYLISRRQKRRIKEKTQLIISLEIIYDWLLSTNSSALDATNIKYSTKRSHVFRNNRDFLIAVLQRGKSLFVLIKIESSLAEARCFQDIVKVNLPVVFFYVAIIRFDILSQLIYRWYISTLYYEGKLLPMVMLLNFTWI